jgi:hypothetical protein
MDRGIRKFIGDAECWARRFSRFCPRDDGLTWRLNLEIFAFSLVLVKARGANASDSNDFNEKSRFIQEASLAFVRHNQGRADNGEDAKSLLVKKLDWTQAGNGDKASEALFRDFCALTGLASSELAGEGVNLASLLFYYAIFSLVTRSHPLERDGQNALLAACRRCKEHFLQLSSLECHMNAPLKLPVADPIRMPVSAAAKKPGLENIEKQP